MITIGEALGKKIKQTPFLEVGLARGIINLSALARELKPDLEQQLWKDITEASIIMALKRYQAKSHDDTASLAQLHKLKNLTVCSNLVEYAFLNSPELLGLQKYLGEKVRDQKELFMNFSQGVIETTLIISEKLQTDIEKRVDKKLIIDKIPNLSSITLRLDIEHIYTPGVQYVLLKALAWEDINLIEVVSSYSEVTVIVEERDVDRAFSCIKQLTSVAPQSSV